MCVYIYIYMYTYKPRCCSLASSRGQDKLFVCSSASNPMHFAICRLSAHVLPQMPYILPRNSIWKSRHFYDDPVCPDPVWKLSSYDARAYVDVVYVQGPVQYNLARTMRPCFRGGARSCIVRPVLRNVWEELVGHVCIARRPCIVRPRVEFPRCFAGPCVIHAISL